MKKTLVYAFTTALFVTGLGLYYTSVNAKETTQKTSTKLDMKSSHNEGEKINWYSFTEGIAKAKKENKYVFIDFYTDWCGYCKKLDKETYSNEKVYKYMNDKFVPIKVNAESDEKVIFDGKPITKAELARSFSVASYPSMFFMETEKKSIGQLPGFVSAKDFLTIASYVGSNAFKTKSIDEYKKTFRM